MIKKLTVGFALVFAALLGVSFTGASQNTKLQNSDQSAELPIYRNVYGELFGASDVIGVNYDQRFKPDSHWGFRAGIGYGFFSDSGLLGISSDHSISIPLAVNAIFGKKCNFFEVGLGYAPIIGFDKYESYWQPDGSFDMDHPTGSKTETKYYSKIFMDLGYRYQKPNGFLFRAGISPSIVGELPWCLLRFTPYVAFGYTFK